RVGAMNSIRIRARRDETELNRMNAMPTSRNLLVMLLLGLSTGMAAGAPENRVFTLAHQRAERVVDQLRGLYGDDLRLSVNGQTLVVRAEPEQLGEIETLLQRIDQPPRQVRLSLRHFANGDPRAGRSNQVYSTGRQSTRSLTVQDQQVAQISSGEMTRLPVAARGGWNPAALLKEVDISSGYLVRPTVLSEDQVELQITAIHNEPYRGRQSEETARMTTVRRVQPGEWVTLGAEDQRRSAPGNTRSYGSQLHGNRLWELQVELLPAP
ncbi:MAG: secretin N-terminal domain-containing protein, partial [Halochromatium sp.]